MENPFGEGSKVTSPFSKLPSENEVKVDDVKEEITEMLAGIDEAPIVPKVIKTRKQAILDSYGGLESNVPINSPYWKS